MTDDDWARIRSKLMGLAIARFGPEQAEDIVQDALVRFFSRAPALRDSRALESYLCRTVINEGVTRWRRRTSAGRVSLLPLADIDPTASDDVEREGEASAELAEIEERLGIDIVELLADYHNEGGRRTAERLGINWDYLRVLVHEARRLIRGEEPTPRMGRSRIARLRRLAEAVA